MVRAPKIKHNVCVFIASSYQTDDVLRLHPNPSPVLCLLKSTYLQRQWRDNIPHTARQMAPFAHLVSVGSWTRQKFTDDIQGLLPKRNGIRSWLSRLMRSRQLLRTGTLILLVFSMIYYMLYDIPSWPDSLSSLTIENTHDFQVLTAPIGFSLPSALPHIPSKIWQIYLAFSPDAIRTETINSFVTHSPSYTYSILDLGGADAVVDYVAETYAGYDRIRPLYDAMSRTVVRADFIRFLILAVEGGVYSDSDTTMLRPLGDWVPTEFKDRARLIVGIEADAGDREDLVGGTSHRVQFCQWTMAGAAGHPAFWGMVDRVLDRVADKVALGKTRFSNHDVLGMGGPAGWTEVLYEHLSLQAGRVVSWEDLTGIREPKLIGDTLILPIDGFATGVPHSGATYPAENYTEDAMVLHHFKGGWKFGGG